MGAEAAPSISLPDSMSKAPRWAGRSANTGMAEAPATDASLRSASSEALACGWASVIASCVEAGARHASDLKKVENRCENVEALSL